MIIITGGAGFIGSNLIQLLNENNIDNIVVVDDFEENPDKWKNLIGLSIYEYIDKNDFLKFIKNSKYQIQGYKISVIIHLGACTDTTNNDVKYMMDNNYSYSKELLELALYNDAQFIYASSAATYGASTEFKDELIPSLSPLNPYALSKHLFDQYVFNSKYRTKAVALKFFNVYGPNECHKGKMSSFINHAFYQFKVNGRVKLFKSNDPNIEDGEQSRDFIYVKDVVNVIYKFMQDFKSGIYNVGSGLSISYNTIVRSVYKSMGFSNGFYTSRGKFIDYIDIPGDISKQYQNFTKANISKLKQEYPDVVKSFKSIEEGINEYVMFLMDRNNYGRRVIDER